MGGRLSKVRYLITPIGLYVNRVKKSIVTLKPDQITLIINKEPQKNEKWRETTQKNCKTIKQDISAFYEEEEIKVKEITVGEYRKSLVGLWNEVHKTRENVPDSRIWIDVTSAPKPFSIAAALVTTFFKNVILRYVPTKRGKDPDQYPEVIKSDPGNAPQEWYLPRTTELNTLEKRLLVTLQEEGGKVKGSDQLLDPLGLEHSKSGKIKLGRLLSNVEKRRLIQQTRLSGREKIVELTEAGKALSDAFSSNFSLNETD